MPSLKPAAIADAYWTSFFDCSGTEFFSGPSRVGFHGPELEDYWGVQALFSNGRVMISIPPGSEALLAEPLADPARLVSPDGFAAAFSPAAALVVGPAYIGYASEISRSSGIARALESSDAEAHARLKNACEEVEWDYGGSPLEQPCSGVFVDGDLVALAGYEVWGGNIAHICIVTHPAFRGHGYASDAVAHVAGRALGAGLLPQYRTLESNTPSIRVAEKLGFSYYASSMAVRLSADGVRPGSPIE